MNKYLTQKIWKLRKDTVTEPGTPYVSLIKVAGKVYQLLFTSCGCNNACTFCNYGFDYHLTKEMVMPELKKINFEEYDIEVLELEANGSFLSEREIPYDLFTEVLEYISNKEIPIITMETHYTTVTERKLQDIRRILGKNQTVRFAFGFESASEKVRKFYNKDIDNIEFIKTAQLCAKYDIALDVNVLLGAPFLTRQQQIQDCLDTLDFVYSNIPEGVEAYCFPINVKNETMLKVWQKRGLYKQISSWEFVELLHRIPEQYLSKMGIAWWGKRENAYTTQEGAIQFPTTCSKCRERLLDFYEEFYCNWDPTYRKHLVEEIWKTRCDCDDGT